MYFSLSRIKFSSVVKSGIGGFFRAQRVSQHARIQSWRRFYSTDPKSAKASAVPKLLQPKVLLIQGILLVAGVAYAMFRFYEQREYEEWVSRASENVKGVGKPQLGGHFTLVDTHGRPVTQATFRGKWHLMYFGFNHCPEICPAQMDKISEVVEKIDAKYGPGTILPIYVTIDPGRDSCATIKEYLKDFSPKYIGLTGTPQQVELAAKNWRVYYNVPDTYANKDDYLVDHSIITYLMSPRLEFKAFFSKEYTVPDITKKTIKIIEDFNKTMDPF